MKVFVEGQALSVVAENDDNESDEVKEFLSRTLCTGQR